jgi:hypothetical protein
MKIFHNTLKFETNTKFGFPALENPRPRSGHSRVRSPSGKDPITRSVTSPATIAIDRELFEPNEFVWPLNYARIS